MDEGIYYALALATSAGGYMAGAASSSRAMKKQYEYNRMLMAQQFEYQKYLAKHSHQFEVEDLRQAGLNPVLSANNGATASVGLNSASAIDNSSNMANTLSDSFNTAYQNAVSAKSVANQKPVQDATVKNLDAQTLTEENKRENLDSQTKFNNLQSEGKAIENLWLPKQIKNSMKYQNDMAKAGLITASSSKALNESTIELNKTKGQLYDVEKWGKALGALVGTGLSIYGLGKLTKLKQLKNIKGVSNFIKPATNYIKF